MGCERSKVRLCIETSRWRMSSCEQGERELIVDATENSSAFGRVLRPRSFVEQAGHRMLLKYQPMSPIELVCETYLYER